MESWFWDPFFALLALFSCSIFYQPKIEDNQILTDQHKIEIKEVLRDQYKNLKEIDFELYLPQNMQPKHIPFIVPNIQLYQVDKNPLNITQLLETVEGGTRIAITGRPGVGKSTLARYISKLWAKGEVFKQFSTLFHICLGKANRAITSLTDMIAEECHCLIDTDDPEIDDLLKEMKRFQGENTVFVLDSFDEYFPNYAKEKKNLFVD